MVLTQLFWVKGLLWESEKDPYLSLENAHNIVTRLSELLDSLGNQGIVCKSPYSRPSASVSFPEAWCPWMTYCLFGGDWQSLLKDNIFDEGGRIQGKMFSRERRNICFKEAKELPCVEKWLFLLGQYLRKINNRNSQWGIMRWKAIYSLEGLHKAVPLKLYFR